MGVAATLILRRGPGGRSPLHSGAHAAGRGVRLAGVAGAAGAELARRRLTGRRRRGPARYLEALDPGAMGEQLRDYLDAAKGAIEDTVSGELRDLQKSLRRRRRQLGL